jgi:hypothetical protein
MIVHKFVNPFPDEPAYAGTKPSDWNDGHEIVGDSDSTKKLHIEIDGFTTGTTRTITPPNANILIAGQDFANVFTVGQLITAHAGIGVDATIDYNPGVTSISTILSIVETFTGGGTVGSHGKGGIFAQIFADPSSSASNVFYKALVFDAQSVGGNTQPLLVLAGVSGNAVHNSDGNIGSYLAGVETNVGNYGGGDVAIEFGIYNYADHYSTGDVGEFYGVKHDLYVGGAITTVAYGELISLFNDGGTVPIAYGLKIEDVTVGTTNYAIYASAGDVSFGDNLFLRTIKSGATQAGAGAAAGEVWKTASHLLLPDNVLLIGV